MDDIALDGPQIAELTLEIPFLTDWHPIEHRPPAFLSYLRVERADPDAPILRPEDIQRDDFVGTVRVATARAWLASVRGLRPVPVADRPVSSLALPGDVLLITESIGPSMQGIHVLYRLLPLALSHDETRRMITRAAARDVAYRIGLSSGADARDPARRDLREELTAFLGTERRAMQGVRDQIPTRPPTDDVDPDDPIDLALHSAQNTLGPRVATEESEDNLFDTGPDEAVFTPPTILQMGARRGSVEDSLSIFGVQPTPVPATVDAPTPSDPSEARAEELLDALGRIRRDAGPKTCATASDLETMVRDLLQKLRAGIAVDDLADQLDEIAQDLTELETTRDE